MGRKPKDESNPGQADTPPKPLPEAQAVNPVPTVDPAVITGDPENLPPAALAPAPPKPLPVYHKVIKPFRDADEFLAPGETPTRYEAGADVSHFNPRRLASLVSRGLVEITGTIDA